MTTDISRSVASAQETVVARMLHSRAAAWVLSIAPIPLFLVRSILVRDNARENRKDSWQRLRESNRRRATKRFGMSPSGMPETASFSMSDARRGSCRKD